MFVGWFFSVGFCELFSMFFIIFLLVCNLLRSMAGYCLTHTFSHTDTHRQQMTTIHLPETEGGDMEMTLISCTLTPHTEPHTDLFTLRYDTRKPAAPSPHTHTQRVRERERGRKSMALQHASPSPYHTQ